jgi:hypothetical protein
MVSRTPARQSWTGIPTPHLAAPGADAARSAPALDHWRTSRVEFLARVAADKSRLKILLKTKDDPYFLEPWIQHHARIAGLGNLVIFDNMSTNAQVLSIYEQYRDRVPIIQYDGHHDAIPHSKHYPAMYDCMKQSCEFYAFLDTDEFLVLIDGDTCACDERIVAFLDAHPDTNAFPASWLMNVTGSDRRFNVGRSVPDLLRTLVWGKPVVRSRRRPDGLINHNIHAAQLLLAGDIVPNLFVLHMVNLFPQQRIDANVRKLISFGYASRDDTIETMLEKNAEDHPDRKSIPTIKWWLKEMRSCLERVRSGDQPGGTLPRGCIELTEDGRVLSAGAAEANALTTFLTGAQPVMHAVFMSNDEEIVAASWDQLTEAWTMKAAAWEREQRGSTATPRNARLLAFYLPQFYPIDENNRWWGKGFTEWTNVARARPLFVGHHQPHMPGSLGFYDLRVPEVREAQADLARRHLIDGFCYWHYWFHGKRLLERPFDEVLASGAPDFPFCLSWANETWSRRWHGTGTPHEVLLEQAYSPEDDINHITWLMKAFADPRYITVRDRPLFIVYKPGDLPDAKRTTDTFRNECVRHGVREPFLLASNSHGDRDFRELGFDGTLEFEPQLGLLPGPTEPGLKMYDYGEARQRMAGRKRTFPVYPSIFVRWDNTPRRAENGIVFTNATPDLFEHGLSQIVRNVMHKPFDERLVFVNAWNEWAEGNHLEPDLQHGTSYLDAVRRANAVSGVRGHSVR